MADIQPLVDYLNIRRRERKAEETNTTVSVLLIDQNYDSTNELNITEDDNMEPAPKFIDIEPSKLVWPMSVSWTVYQKNIYLRVVDDNDTPGSLQYYQRHQYTNDLGQEIIRYKNYADLSQWIALDESEIITIPIIHDKGRYYYLSDTNRIVINYSLDKTFLFQDKFFFNPADIPEIKTGSDYSLDYVDHEGYADSGLDALWRFLFFSDAAYERNIKNRQVTIKNTGKTGDVFILPDIYYRQGRYILSYRKADGRFTKSSFENSEIYLQLTFNYLGTMMEFLYQTVFNEDVLSLDSIYDATPNVTSALVSSVTGVYNGYISNYIEDSFSNVRKYFLSKYLQLVEDEIPWRGRNVEDALEVLYYTSDIFLEYMDTEVLWEIVGKALEQSLDNIGLNEEDVMLILLDALRKKGKTADVFLNTLLKKRTKDKSSYFSKLYSKLNTSSFSRFIYLLLEEWNKSSYSDPKKREVKKVGDKYLNPVVCGYTSGTSWSFFHENTNFEWAENDYIEIEVTQENGIVKNYKYHPFDLVAISNAQNEDFSFTGKKLDQINLIPAVALFAHSDVTFWQNVTLTAEYVGDAISVAVGLGPAWRSFRILSALAKATTTAQKAFVITRSAVGVMEVTAGTANIILKATELRKTEFGKSLASVFMWMEFASLGTDVAVGVAKRLSASAKRALAEADKLLKEADKITKSGKKTNKSNKVKDTDVQNIGGLPEPEFRQLGHLLLGQLEGAKYFVGDDFRKLAGNIADTLKTAGVQLIQFPNKVLLEAQRTFEDILDNILFLGTTKPENLTPNGFAWVTVHADNAFLMRNTEEVKNFYNAMGKHLGKAGNSIKKGAQKSGKVAKNIDEVAEAFEAAAIDNTSIAYNRVREGKITKVIHEGKVLEEFTSKAKVERYLKKIYKTNQKLFKSIYDELTINYKNWLLENNLELQIVVNNKGKSFNMRLINTISKKVDYVGMPDRIHSYLKLQAFSDIEKTNLIEQSYLIAQSSRARFNLTKANEKFVKRFAITIELKRSTLGSGTVPTFTPLGNAMFLKNGKLGNGAYDDVIEEGFSILEVESALQKIMKHKGVAKNIKLTGARSSDFNNVWDAWGIDRKLGNAIYDNLELTLHHMDDVSKQTKGTFELIHTPLHDASLSHTGNFGIFEIILDLIK